MVELLLSILISLGLSTSSVDGKYKANENAIQSLKAQPEYDKLGGDGALLNIFLPDDVDPRE